MGVSGQNHAPAALYPEERTPGTHCTGGWVGPRAGLDAKARGTFSASVRNRTPVVQPVVRHYTDWASAAPHNVDTYLISEVSGSHSSSMKMASFGLFRRVAWHKFTNISEVPTASIIRAIALMMEAVSNILFFTTTPRPALGLTQLPI
jgi:hypothetical protein